MRRQLFIPAKNSRHRIAVLSLYRALLRSANKIEIAPLSDRLEPKKAMAHALKKAFVRNREYTSYRLVYASMTAGYKFLTLLSKAQIPGSPERNQLITHLASRQDLKPQIHEHKGPPERPREPFLKNIAEPGDPPVYKPTYIPDSFKTRIPSVAATAHGLPFLRLKKPQPKELSKMIGRKAFVFADKVEKMVGADEDMGWDAIQEDQWDKLVAKQAELEGVTDDFQAADAVGKQSGSFLWTVQLTKLWWEWKIDKIWQDWIARGKALNELVEEHKAQAQMGQEVNTEESLREDAPQVMGRLPSQYRDPPNAAVFVSPLRQSLAAIAEGIARREDGEGGFVDLSEDSEWSALVKLQKYRLQKWAASVDDSRDLR